LIHKEIYVAGLPVVDADIEAALDSIWSDVEARAFHAYALVNAYSASLCRSSCEYAAALTSSSTVPLPDGASLAFGARALGLGRLGRCPGPDLMDAGAARAAADGTAFALLGGNEGVAQDLAHRLVSRHQGLRVVLAEAPPFGVWPQETSLSLCRLVRDSGASVLWLGVSAPKQEIWADEFLDQVEIPIVCVGAAFDFLAQRKPRAPRWMRTIGLEWFFRLATEPRRLWRRYLIGNAVFVSDLLRYRRRRRGV